MSQETATALRLARPSLFLLCSLQLLDVITTLSFLGHSVSEANPLVNWLFAITGSPLTGLVVAKLLAIGLGLWCARLGKVALLERVNLFYGILVGWNMIALLVALSSK